MTPLTAHRSAPPMCPKCNMSLDMQDEVAFTGEHLNCFIADLGADRRPIGGGSADFATERRESPRYAVSREARLVLSGGAAYAKVRTVNISTGGIAVERPDKLPATLFARGTTLDIAIVGDDAAPVCVRRGEVRHLTARTIGLKVEEALPPGLFDLPHDA